MAFRVDSTNISVPNHQLGDGGESPTSTHQFRLEEITRKQATSVIELFHYSKSTRGVNGRINLGLMFNGKIYGVAIVGQPATPNVAAKYSAGGMLKVLELRRFCCVDATPKNTESYFLSKIIWWLRKNTDCDRVISFADETYGHSGTIYKAANWREIGVSAPEKKIEWRGFRYHRRALWQHTRPQQKAAILAALESGEARWVKTLGKKVFHYDVNRSETLRPVLSLLEMQGSFSDKAGCDKTPDSAY